MKTLVSTHFLEQVKRMSTKGRKKFVGVPPGDAKMHSSFPQGLSKGPEIKYKQSNEERICLVASFASFLHSVDCRQHAAQLFNEKHKIQENAEVWPKFMKFMTSTLSPHLNLERFQCDEETLSKFAFPDLPIVTSVVDSRGQDDHCITIYKNWIYDGNFTHALPLNQESLDNCCSSDKLKLSFMSMKDTYYIPAFDTYLQKSRDKAVDEKRKRKRREKNKRKHQKFKKMKKNKK